MQFIVVEGNSVDVTIKFETTDGMPLDTATDVTLRISDNAGTNPPLLLSRLQGDITVNGFGDSVVSFTIPVNTASGSTVSFTGLTIEDNAMMEGTDLEFVLNIDNFGLQQTTGAGISGFTSIFVEDDDDGKSL